MISKTQAYREFVDRMISSGEIASSLIGNLYTGSIFASIISCLSADEDVDLSRTAVGLFAYGSGSKAKVFEAHVVDGYREKMERIDLFTRLARRKSVSFDEYVYLHNGKLMYNLDSIERRIFHVSSGCIETNRFSRDYQII